MQQFVPAAAAGLGNAVARVRNAVAQRLPGERPRQVVIELHGSYPARKPKQKLVDPMAFLGGERPTTLEEFSGQVDEILRSPFIEGVIFRFGSLDPGYSALYALAREFARLRASGRRVTVWASELSTSTYYLAAAADEVVMPESAMLMVNGFGLTTLFMGQAFDRLGIRYEKRAIREYKNAGDQFALPAMSDAQREQYEELVESIERHYVEFVAERRRTTVEAVRSWIDESVSSAARAQQLGMIDRIAYEDELPRDGVKTYREAQRFIPARTDRDTQGRVAVVSLEGMIVTGKSRKMPLPLPLFGEQMAGSETIVRALRTAGKDPGTKAIVFHVESGGGSALASDLIWREVMLLARRMPVVAVMGDVAGSGGYYVLTHATRVLAAPTTITGSIGVVLGKFVLAEFNERYGFNPESVLRGRHADLLSSSRSWDEGDDEVLWRFNNEIYDRFTARVAQGRGLSQAQVDEIGRGRIWSGATAATIGLVDELGDIGLAIERARELAGLPAHAPVWNVHAPAKLLLPEEKDPQALLRQLAPHLSGPVLLTQPTGVKLSR